MRQCFLRFFAVLLAIIAGLSIATILGAPQEIWRADASHMSAVIALVFVTVVAVLGRASWTGEHRTAIIIGELGVLLSPALGMIGTVRGFVMQSASIGQTGAASWGALETALDATGVGIASFAVLAILVANLMVEAPRAP